MRAKAMQKYTSVMVLLMYVFVLFFSSKFHQHSHGFFDLDSPGHGKKVHLNVEKSASNDCVACHFLTNKTSFLPEVFKFKAIALADDYSEKSLLILKESFAEIQLIRLRGPPSV